MMVKTANWTCDTGSRAPSLPADGQLHDNSVPGSRQWAGTSVQQDVSQLCLHNPGASGGNSMTVGVHTKQYISQQGVLASNGSQEHPGLH